MPAIIRPNRRKWHEPLPDNASETTISAAIRSHVNRFPWAKLWRNNNGSLEDKTGRWVTYGLGTGSPDLIGVVANRETGIGIFVGIEVKKGARDLEHDQKEWRTMLTELGAVHGVANCVEDAIAAVAMARGITPFEAMQELEFLRS